VHFSLGLPIHELDASAELGADAIAEVARGAEQVGFDACYVTDHPFPVDRWLREGGHATLDPFVALSFAAAATTTLKLQTHILVLPYRNPFLVAKAAASLDALSGGRLILGVGTGYLRGEFEALGADFEHRNEVADEAIEAIRVAWTEDDVRFEGRQFRAVGNTLRPRPVQTPRPPIWVGGNSRRAIRRAAELGDGWVPFPNPAPSARHTRTTAIESIADLAALLEYAREERARESQTRAWDVCFALGPFPDARFDAPEVLDAVGALAAIGVTWLAVPLSAPTRTDFLRATERFGAEVIARAGG
jgi:probable F420-dependent oxidoreductase